MKINDRDAAHASHVVDQGPAASKRVSLHHMYIMYNEMLYIYALSNGIFVLVSCVPPNDFGPQSKFIYEK